MEKNTVSQIKLITGNVQTAGSIVVVRTLLPNTSPPPSLLFYIKSEIYKINNK